MEQKPYTFQPLSEFMLFKEDGRGGLETVSFILLYKRPERLNNDMIWYIIWFVIGFIISAFITWIYSEVTDKVKMAKTEYRISKTLILWIIKKFKK